MIGHWLQSESILPQEGIATPFSPEMASVKVLFATLGILPDFLLLNIGMLFIPPGPELPAAKQPESGTLNPNLRNAPLPQFHFVMALRMPQM